MHKPISCLSKFEGRLPNNSLRTKNDTPVHFSLMHASNLGEGMVKWKESNNTPSARFEKVVTGKTEYTNN